MDLSKTNTVLDHARFTKLWNQAAKDFDAHSCDHAFSSLTQAYTSAGRHYHSDDHIRMCLAKLDEEREQSDPDNKDLQDPTVELAIWFHDAVYQAGDPENEHKSALWFAELAEQQFDRKTIGAVFKLIMATTHRDQPATRQEELTVDIDLSSFALPREQFLLDGLAIRQEFGHLTTEEFVASQSRFLRNLLDRPSIYYSAYFYDNYESIARANIEYLLDRYEQGDFPQQSQAQSA